MALPPYKSGDFVIGGSWIVFSNVTQDAFGIYNVIVPLLTGVPVDGLGLATPRPGQWSFFVARVNLSVEFKLFTPHLFLEVRNVFA